MYVRTNDKVFKNMGTTNYNGLRSNIGYQNGTRHL